MLLPCVLDSAPRRETRRFAVLPLVTVMDTDAPYVQSVFWIVKVGCARPERRYGGVKTSTRYSSGLTLSSGSEPETMTRPSWRRMASEW